ncbi:MAG: pyrroline-5-carboxylate reductase [Syntrophobacteraceae bacterium CG2_30_61_12]|nr:MAG: pyrroline-5-carboxylate reductase [Syntrophobacteraceae bacterium CG2_30_61_12]PIU31178.1 MAG: pyrroline-5-carboxylate reductase [Syntrophobacteraceae bacterium CG07_land_8_20_14_0_80_61_8]
MFDQVMLGFIGGGNMGGALIKGLTAAGLPRPDQILVHDVDRDRLRDLESSYGVKAVDSLTDLVATATIVVLAVKPQVMNRVLTELKGRLPHRPLIISIAAGVAIDTIARGLGEDLPIVRVMPNTPALVQESASALARNAAVSDHQMEQALKLFEAVGVAVAVEEKLMDAVTGLSGSGPAYVLQFVESLIDGGVLMGLPRPIARKLVVQTVFGTARMILETGRHPAELKDMITSPGGTTISGLQVLEAAGLRGAIMDAVEAATLRSRELGRPQPDAPA